MTVWLAGLAAAAAAGVLGWQPTGGLQRLEHRPREGSTARSARARRVRALTWTAGTGTALAVVLGPTSRLVLGLAAAALVFWAVRRLLAQGRARKARDARRRHVVELCDALAAELRSGLPMPSGIARCCARDAELAPVAHVASLGGDVGEAFRACAQAPGADGLRAVAAAWDVAEQTGAALAEVLDRVATGLRAEDEGRAEVEAALEPPRATAKLLAVLPILGLGLGTSIDAHPVGFLVGTSIGWGCLCAGTALALLGVLWVEHLASGAEV